MGLFVVNDENHIDGDGVAILYIITNMVYVRLYVCFLSFWSYLPLPNLPKLLFTERQGGGQ
jgi:hypothetical protein